MSRNAWIAIALVAAVLVGLLAWPSGNQQNFTRWSLITKLPGEWRLVTPKFDQQVLGAKVVINGYERPLDPQVARKFWELFAALETAVEPRSGVDAANLGAWGIDDQSPRLTAEDIDLRWAVDDGQLWFYDGQARRILRFPERTAARVTAVVKRFDRAQLVEVPSDLNQIALGDVQLKRDDQAWLFAADQARPVANGRVQAVLHWVSNLRCSNLTRSLAVPLGWPAHTLMVGDQKLSIYAQGDQSQVAVDHLPPQPLAANQVAELTLLIERFGRDELFDEGRSGGQAALANTIQVLTGGQESFVIERAGMDDVNPSGDSQWSVRWSGGLEPAFPTVGRNFLASMYDVVVTKATKRTVRLADPPPATSADVTTVVLSGNFTGGKLWMQWRGDRVESPTHSATLVSYPELFDDLQPGVAMDRRLVNADPMRLDKIQRVWPADNFRAEVMTRDRGSWVQQQIGGSPSRPELVETMAVSSAAVLRLAIELVTARSQAVRIDGELAQAIRADPQRRELAVRIAALEDDGAVDLDILEDTVSRELGLVLRPRDGQWDVAESDGVVVWQVSQAVVDTWFGNVSPRSVVPLSPSRMRAISVAVAGQADFTLRLVGGEWRIERVDQSPVTADQAAVRAYLLALTDLEWQERDPAAAALAASGSVAGVITIESPGFGEVVREKHVLVLGLTRNDGLVPASLGRGQLVLSASAVSNLLPAVDAFLPSAALDSGE